jgi:hypothetical protein
MHRLAYRHYAYAGSQQTPDHPFGFFHKLFLIVFSSIAASCHVKVSLTYANQASCNAPRHGHFFTFLARFNTPDVPGWD